MRQHTLRSLALLLAVSLLGGCAAVKQSNLDYQLNTMCAIEGGIEVYEKVELPAHEVNEAGMPSFFNPLEPGNELGANYSLRTNQYYFEKPEHPDGPSLLRTELTIYRIGEVKQLGRLVRYGRQGPVHLGTLVQAWSSCSQEASLDALVRKVFVPGTTQ